MPRRADMPATARFEDLTVWQRMLELNLEVRKAATRGAAGRNVRFANAICHAADSAERNVTEGFGRFNAAECARFLALARASSLKTRTLLRTGLAAGYWSQEEFDRLDALAVRSLEALAAFQRYLPFPRAGRKIACRYRRRRPNVPNPNVPNDSNDPNDPNDQENVTV